MVRPICFCIGLISAPINTQAGDNHVTLGGSPYCRGMGNEITAIAPSQILPIESYFSGEDTVSDIKVLSSTRFFKTVRGIHRGGGEAVVKVLVKYDLPDHYTKTYHQVLSDVQLKLQSVPNALPYFNTWETDRAAFLMRQHVRHNLYDMFSSRPALSSLEKKWIVFQLLQSLKGSHQQRTEGVPTCHGDIKSENVLLTGWNWVYLSDYAPFKPTELPMDNPGDYDFYFDTSRRRTCYIAVERFIDPAHRAPQPRAPLTEAMDIFSLGCVVGEMFSDGRQLFTLSELLDYKRQLNKPQLKWIKDEHVKTMVEHMIQRSPEERYSAEEYLHVFDGCIFPGFFSSFLHKYMMAFTHGTGDFEGALKPDQRIERLYTDIDKILRHVGHHDDSPSRETGYGDGLVVILSAITSHVRVLQLLSTKAHSLEMLRLISQHIRDEFILDRVVPYLLFFVSDFLPEVKAQAIRTLTHCLSMVTRLPKGDVNLFQDYIFPGLLHVPEDHNVSVRVALAESLADLTAAAQRFLEIGLHNASLTSDDDYQTLGSYDNELSLMRSQVAKMVTAFLSDQDNTVKKSTMMHLKKLCPFFGFQQAKDVILVHLITYLNDKEDWQLHRVFFECIVDVVAYLGWPAVQLVQALLLQGLNDPEEQVISKAIDAVAAMVRLKMRLFKLQQLLEFVDQIRPFLIHPNIWTRYAAVGLVSSVSEELGPIDSACFLQPKLEQFLTEREADLTDRFVLLSMLRPSLPRQVYDYILRQGNLREFFELLSERQSSRSLTRPGYTVKYGHIPDRLDPVIRRMTSLGMNEAVEDQLLILQDVILKIQTSKQFGSDQPPPSGLIDLEACGVVGEVMKFEVLNEDWYLDPAPSPAPMQSVVIQPSSTLTAADQQQTGSNDKTKKESTDEVDEWNLMFGEDSNNSRLRTLPAVGGAGRVGPPFAHATPSGKRSSRRLSTAATAQYDAMFDIDQNLPSAETRGLTMGGGGGGGLRTRKQKHRRSRSDTSSLVAGLGRDAGLIDARQKVVVTESTWGKSLDMLKQHKMIQYNLGQLAMLGKVPWENGFFRVRQWRNDPSAGPLKLVSHLQEHKLSINKIRSNKGSSMFATFSNDSTLKLWDASRLDQLPFILKSKCTHKFEGGRVLTGVFCNDSTAVAAANSQGYVGVFSVDQIAQKNSLPLSQVYEQPLDSVGHVVDMLCLDASRQQTLLCLATSQGTLTGIDLRAGKTVWSLKQDPEKGLLTSFTVDPWETWVATGTSIGYHTVWDMRFRLPINSWQYREGNLAGPVYALSPHPQSHSLLLSALEGNNEVSAWNMETGQKTAMLWASHHAPPFNRTSKESRNTSVRGLSCGFIEGDPVVLTAGNDRRIRLWNLANPDLTSCLLSPADNKEAGLRYKSTMIEGVNVTAEVLDPGLSGLSSKTPPEQMGIPHIDIINDIVVIQRGSQPYVLSGGHNGELKIWR